MKWFHALGGMNGKKLAELLRVLILRINDLTEEELQKLNEEKKTGEVKNLPGEDSTSSLAVAG